MEIGAKPTVQAEEARAMNYEAQVPQSEIGRLYDRLSAIYDLWGTLTESKARQKALKLANVQNGQTVLEVAVGTGLAFREIVKANPGGVNSGIDLSAGMLKRAEFRLKKSGLTNYTLNIGSAFDLKQADGTVDVLLNSYMFDLIPFADMGKVLAEFGRVLKKDGKLVLVNMTQGERPGSRIYDRIYGLLPRAMGGCRGIKLSQLLLEHGFQIQNREYVQQLLFPSEIILASK